MVAGVIASRVFPAEPLNHRSLATARRQNEAKVKLVH
jgi:hypothetical protein